MKSRSRFRRCLWFHIGALLLLTACAQAPAPACEAPEGVHAYEAKDIGQQWIDYVWVEVPVADESASLRTDAERTVSGRLFVASADPVGAIVPTMIDLKCEAGPVQYAPASVEFAVDPQGNLKSSYSWGSCARCSECYMKWTFSLDVNGHLQGGALVADLVLNETFHSGPMKIVSVRMEDVTAACTEPRMRCTADGKCAAINNVERK